MKTKNNLILGQYRSVPLKELFDNSHDEFKSRISKDISPVHLSASYTNGTYQANVIMATGEDFDEAWKKLSDQLKEHESSQVRWLKLDYVDIKEKVTWGELKFKLSRSLKTHFRYGISFDSQFNRAFLEQELNANVMLYEISGNNKYGEINYDNFKSFYLKKYSEEFVTPEDDCELTLFATQGILFEPDQHPIPLHGHKGDKNNLHTGRRIINSFTKEILQRLIIQSSLFLSKNTNKNGRFVYGHRSCNGTVIKSYNALRNAGTLYSMIQAWEIHKSEQLMTDIKNGLRYMEQEMVSFYTPSLYPKLPQTLAYVVDKNYEIKLGANGTYLLALVKYMEVTEDYTFLPLARMLACGIKYLQDPENGNFVHVIDSRTLAIKNKFRIVYYDGEVCFGLLRYYQMTKEPKWLDMVEKAFGYYIKSNYWRYRDHWMAYSVNELVKHRPLEEYYSFGIKNVQYALDSVINSIGISSTYLELMMASHNMILNMRYSQYYKKTIKQLDLDKFYYALEIRSHYLLDGYFWPEVAMYFLKPSDILGGFFIRNRCFRARIDDTQHPLSGFISYMKDYHPIQDKRVDFVVE